MIEMTAEYLKLQQVREELHVWLADMAALKSYAEFAPDGTPENAFGAAFRHARRRALALALEYASLTQPQ